MPIHNVGDLASALHEAGVVNLETKVSDVLKVAGVGELSPGSLVASGAIAWDGYVIVYKGMPAGLNELAQLRQRVTEGGG
jgi:hypothetical protein